MDATPRPGSPRRPPLELWGGLECTVNRVGDRFFDQLRASGHDRRIADLDLVADLGVRAMRYPVLWERTAPDTSFRCDFTWSDRRLTHLRARGSTLMDVQLRNPHIDQFGVRNVRRAAYRRMLRDAVDLPVTWGFFDAELALSPTK